jgi:hypothetical protein
MLSNYKIRNASSWTMLLFGAAAFLLGLLGIIKPELMLGLLGFEIIDRPLRAGADYTLVFLLASSMASFNMGVYYILAALNNLKKFYVWTVPFRCVTFTVFTLAVLTGFAPGRFVLLALWELTGAVLTGLALYAERGKGTA